MPPSPRQVLEIIVACDDRGDTPVTAETLADACDSDVTTVRDRLRTLVGCELVTRRPPPNNDRPGYAPTITARELLALDLDEDSILIVDPGDC